MQILSLGGGVQSSTLLLMSVSGQITPKADAAFFADTGWERQGTYLHKTRRKDFKLYLHESLAPLEDVLFDNPDQLTLFQENTECEGGCFL